MKKPDVKADVLFYAKHRRSLIDSASSESLTCKFVVINHDGQRCLVVGPLNEFPYHANLVDKYCNEHSIAAAWLHKPDLVEIFEANVRVLGGGWLEINPKKKLLRLYGHSTAYGVFDRPTAIAALSHNSDMAAYRIDIE